MHTRPDLGCCATEKGNGKKKSSAQDITNSIWYSYVNIVFTVSTVNGFMLGFTSAVSFDTANYLFFGKNLLTRM